MPDTRECPLCGGTMLLKHAEREVRLPGNPRPTLQRSSEWTCPDCDYYEEAEEEGT